jgi:hypothetical protein
MNSPQKNLTTEALRHRDNSSIMIDDFRLTNSYALQFVMFAGRISPVVNFQSAMTSIFSVSLW